ncbi:MAG: hypothetical protein ACI9N1_001172 [Flavobacteriales bacterium]|jgi:hypothetical protein
MKNILLLLLLFCITIASAQDTLLIEIDNPQPRIGDEVKLTFSFDALSKVIETQLNDGTEVINDFANAKKIFTKTIIFTKPGKNTLGPFEFDFNGNKVISDSIIVYVKEELPFEEGLWIRFTEDKDGSTFLIIEQYKDPNSKSHIKRKKESNSNIYGLQGNDEFVELTSETLEGISFSFTNSNSKPIYQSDKGSFSGKSLNYSFKKYKVYLDPYFQGVFTLKKKYLVNLPSNVDYTEVKISN